MVNCPYIANLQKYFAKEMGTQHEFVEILLCLTIRNHYFSNYVSGMGENKVFYPVGNDGWPFTSEEVRAIVVITNETLFMRNLLKLFAAFTKEEKDSSKRLCWKSLILHAASTRSLLKSLFSVKSWRLPAAMKKH